MTLVAALLLTPLGAAGQGSARTAVLDYLRGLETSRGVLVGQFGFYGEAETIKSARDYIAGVEQSGGKTPALTGCDLGAVSAPMSECAAWGIEAWRKGMLVTVSWHARNPFGEAPTGESRAGCLTPAQCNLQRVSDLLTPSANPAAYGRYRSELGQVGDALATLRNAGVVVIWRPFHEMNGAWFWWHQQPKSDFVALWRDMHAYLTVTRGIDNLLWAYSPNTPWDKWAQKADFYYPGADVVDVVGLDWYAPRGGGDNLNDFGGYTQIAALPHPVMLLEYGPSPASGAGWQDAKFDWVRLMGYLENYPRIVGFQAWEYIWAIPRHTNIKGLMDHPRAIDASELPAWGSSAGTATVSPTRTAIPASPTPAPLASATPTRRPSATPEPQCPQGWVELDRVPQRGGGVWISCGRVF
jgi:mannan endo-1,4-beta-mannosidase